MNPKITKYDQFTYYEFNSGDFIISLADDGKESLTLDQFYRTNINSVGQGKYKLRSALQWIIQNTKFRRLTLYASPSPAEIKTRGINKKEAQLKLNTYYTSLGMTAYHDPEIDDPGEENSFQGDIEHIISTIGQAGGGTQAYARTLCNDLGISCRDKYGKYIPQTKLLEMLRAFSK